MESLCLEYVRVAALLRHQLYCVPLPRITDPLSELALLEQTLGLQDTFSVVNTDTIRELCSVMCGIVFCFISVCVTSLLRAGFVPCRVSYDSCIAGKFSGKECGPPTPPHLLLATCLAAWCPPLVAMAAKNMEATSCLLNRQLYARPTVMDMPKIYEFLFMVCGGVRCWCGVGVVLGCVGAKDIRVPIYGVWWGEVLVWCWGVLVPKIYEFLFMVGGGVR